MSISGDNRMLALGFLLVILGIALLFGATAVIR